MKIILKKVRKKTPFSWIDPIKVEPLELEYLKAVLEDLGLEGEICDDLYHKENSQGDIVILNGYNTARNQMLLEAKQIKDYSPKTIVIGSGVDVQVNWALYEGGAFDYLVISNRLSDFKDLIAHLVFKKQTAYKGVLDLNGDRAMLDSEAITTFESVTPSRAYFKRIKHQTRYLLYEQVALVKRSHSCPYACDFCFCKQLNKGQFVSRSYEGLKREMADIQADYFWVVDDVFIHNAVEAAAFIEAFKNTAFKMIVYLRADFIANHPELMKALKEAGIIEVIIGFESIKASVLKTYNKGYAPDINSKAIAVLKRSQLSYTALFMLDIGADYADFKALRQYIKQHQIPNYTFSIFTPLRGTDLYDVYEKDILDFKCEHYDFLHLVLKPLKMSQLAFRLAFIELFVFQFFQSQSARRFIFKRLKESLKKASN